MKFSLAALLLIPVVFAQPAAHDRILTDEMQGIDASVKKLSSLAEKGKFDEIEKEVKIIEKWWGNVRAELKLRGESSAASEFESAFAAVKEASRTKDKAARQLGTAFGNIKKVMQSAEVDASRLLAALGFFVFAWILLTISALKISEKLKVKG